MRLVVADTGPLSYLVLTGCVDLLPKLFEKVSTPVAVQAELLDPDAPAAVRTWAAQPPPWLEISPGSAGIDDPARRARDAGERPARALAGTVRAGLGMR